MSKTAEEIAERIVDPVDSDIYRTRWRVATEIREAEQRGFQRGVELPYLLSCPFCGESQADRIVTAQIGHLIKCGWNTREKAVREAEQRGIEKGREQVELNIYAQDRLVAIAQAIAEAEERGRALEREELIIILKQRWHAAALVQEIVKLLEARGI